jgi:hypothetical protein
MGMPSEFVEKSPAIEFMTASSQFIDGLLWEALLNAKRIRSSPKAKRPDSQRGARQPPEYFDRSQSSTHKFAREYRPLFDADRVACLTLARKSLCSSGLALTVSLEVLKRHLTTSGRERWCSPLQAQVITVLSRDNS